MAVESLYPDSKVQEADMGPIWGQQDPGGPHGPMNLAICVRITSAFRLCGKPSSQWQPSFYLEAEMLLVNGLAAM